MSGDRSDKDPSESGSIDVAVSAAIPKAADDAAIPIPMDAIDSAPVSSGRVTESIASYDSQPVSSGRVKAIVASDQTGPVGLSKRQKAAAVVSGGVEALGSGIGSLGEGVSKVGQLTRKVPLVGAGVAKLGEGLTTVGESVHALPGMSRTRHGRLLLRSALVGFVLVFAWISVIVALQLRSHDSPDFRPDAESILIEISKGGSALDAVYETASPRFQEMVRKERFIDDMTDLNKTVGKFREIAAINDTIVTRGPTGRIGRVSLTIIFQKATCHGSVSFHYDQDDWKLLGIGIELPPELKITQAEREQRVQACEDPLAKSCDIYVIADKLLSQLRDGHAGEVYDAATPIFQKQEERSTFIAIQAEHKNALGAYQRIIHVSEAKVIGGTSATYDAIAQYDKAEGVRTIIGLTRASKTAPWLLRSFKTVVPVPRAADLPKKPPPVKK